MSHNFVAFDLGGDRPVVAALIEGVGCDYSNTTSLCSDDYRFNTDQIVYFY